MTPNRHRPPLHLALVSIEYPPDPFSSGIGAYTKALAHGLVSRGHRIHVVTRGSSTRVDDEAGVTVHRLTPGRPKIPNNLQGMRFWRFLGSSFMDDWRYRQRIAQKLQELIHAGEVDLIEAADHMAEPFLFFPRKYPRVPFIVRLHTPLAVSEKVAPNMPESARQFIRFFERRYLLGASHLSAPSRVSAEVCRREMALGDKPIEVFPNPPTYPLQHDDHGEEDPNLVLFVGRIAKLKGVDLLMHTIPEVLQQHPKARFMFVGAANVAIGGFASARDYLYSLLPTTYHDHLIFTGHLPHEQVANYYRKAAVCVFPSLFEAFGYTCLEAMTYAKAVVGSTSGGMAELLEDGRAGRLFTPPDVDELTEHIITLLGDVELRRCLGGRARQRALRYYNLDRVLTEVEAFYRRTLHEAQQGGRR